MKPVVTWIVLANAKTARILQNRGPQKGVTATDMPVLHAPELVEYADQGGMLQGGGNHSQAAGERDAPKLAAEHALAQEITSGLTQAREAGKFDRLIVSAGPHMLGILRSEMPENLRAAVMAEMDRDLTQATLDELPQHLNHIIAA